MSTAALPPTIIFQGTGDGTVWPANARRNADQWLAHYGQGDTRPKLRLRETRHQQKTPVTKSSRRGYTVQRWSMGKQRVLEMWLVEGLPHACRAANPAYRSVIGVAPGEHGDVAILSAHRNGDLSP